MKTQLIIIGLLATLAANGQTPYTAEVKWWPPANFALGQLHTIYPEDSFPMPPVPTTDWGTNTIFCGREIGFRSDGAVVWRWPMSVTNSNGESLILTNQDVMTNSYIYYTNSILGDILGNATKPSDLFRVDHNGVQIYVSLEGVTNLVQLDEKIGHVWNFHYPNSKNRSCILCGKRQVKTEEWK